MGTWNFLPYMEELGRLYAEAEDNSGDPRVQSAWKALAADSVARAAKLDDQYDTKVVQFEPYENAEQQDYDVRNYNQFLVSDQNSEHPIWTVEENVAFRKVHDLMGHIPSGGDFSWEGENRACGVHFKFLSGEARIALFVECILQTAAVQVFGRFLEQKCFIPDNFDPVEGYTPLGEAQDYRPDAGKIYWNRGAKLKWKSKSAAIRPEDMEELLKEERLYAYHSIAHAQQDSGKNVGDVPGFYGVLYDVFFENGLVPRGQTNNYVYEDSWESRPEHVYLSVRPKRMDLVQFRVPMIELDVDKIDADEDFLVNLFDHSNTFGFNDREVDDLLRQHGVDFPEDERKRVGLIMDSWSNSSFGEWANESDFDFDSPGLTMMGIEYLGSFAYRGGIDRSMVEINPTWLYNTESGQKFLGLLQDAFEEIGSLPEIHPNQLEMFEETSDGWLIFPY